MGGPLTFKVRINGSFVDNGKGLGFIEWGIIGWRIIGWRIIEFQGNQNTIDASTSQ